VYNFGLAAILVMMFVGFRMWREAWRRPRLAWGALVGSIAFQVGVHVPEHAVRIYQYLRYGWNPAPGILGHTPLHGTGPFDLLVLHFWYNAIITTLLAVSFFSYRSWLGHEPVNHPVRRRRFGVNLLPRPAGADLASVFRPAMAAAAFGAAAIHAAVVPGHARESWVLGAFFFVVAVLQAAWGGALLVRRTRGTVALGAVGMGLVILVWALSRAAGVPVGPEAWSPERLGLLDGAATVFEVLAVAGALALLHTSIGGRAIDRVRAGRWSAGLGSAAAASTAGVILAPGGRTTLARAGDVVLTTTHVVHIALFAAGLVAFASYVTVNVARGRARPRVVAL
jgi:hypothetical protein